MEHLPPELLTYILCKLDGHSLACAARVCRLWHRIVSILGEAFNIWYRQCLNEMGLDSIVAHTGLTQLMTTPGRKALELRRSQWDFWREMYGAYQRCHCLVKENWVREADRICGGYTGTVTAVALVPPMASNLGLLWFSTCQGYIHGGRLYKNWFSGFKNERLGQAHINGCTDMATVTVDGCTGFSTVDDVQPTSFVVSTGIQGVVRISDVLGCSKATIEPRHHQAYCVSALGPYFVVGHDSCITQGMIIYKLVMERKDGWLKCCVTLVPVMKLSGFKTSCVRAVALSHSQVAAGDDSGNLYSWTIPPLSNFDDVTSHLKLSLDSLAPKITVKIQTAIEQVLIHNDQTIALCAQGFGLRVFDNKNWNNMYLIGEGKFWRLGRISGYVVSLAVSGDVLAVGCQSGEVLFFDVKSKDWPENLQQHFICCVKADMERLVTIKLADDGQGTVLVMGGTSVSWIRWRKKRLSRQVVKTKLWKGQSSTVQRQSEELNRDKL